MAIFNFDFNEKYETNEERLKELPVAKVVPIGVVDLCMRYNFESAKLEQWEGRLRDAKEGTEEHELSKSRCEGYKAFLAETEAELKRWIREEPGGAA